MPSISVIVPIYMVEPYLRRCVDSILAQTFPDFELILVDDGSPDSCGQICEEYARLDRRVLVIHQENRGLSAARNAGIDWVMANSDSSWITFVDSDDWIHPNMLKHLFELNRDHGTQISACSFHVTAEECTQLPHADTSVSVYTPGEYFCISPSHAVYAWGKLYHRDCFSQIRYPVGRIYEDAFTTHRLVFTCDKVAAVRIPYYFYYSNPDGITKCPWTPKRLDHLDAIEEQVSFFSARGLHKVISHQLNYYVGECNHRLLWIRRSDNPGTWQKERRILRRKRRWALCYCIRHKVSLSPLMQEYRQWLLRRLKINSR